MKNNIRRFASYIIQVLVFLASFLSAYFLPIDEFYKNLITIPGIGALCLALYKTWKDEQLQNKQQDFILGTTSHMAEIAYDKHVSFCEEYVNRLQVGLQELYRDGASKNSINIGRDLVNIRQRHSTWLTRKIEKNLKPIEEALIEMGAKEHLLDYQGVGELRTETVTRVYKLLSLILGHEKTGNDKESGLAIDEVIEIIRNIVGINALTDLRLEATKLAISRLKRL